jgi:hypothetical protein
MTEIPDKYPLSLPADGELEAPFSADEITPAAVAGSCWKCGSIVPIQIVAPPPGSTHEWLQFGVCIASRGGLWAFCAVRPTFRVRDYECYIGADMRRREFERRDTPKER